MHHIGLVFPAHFTSSCRAIFTPALKHFSAANISEWDDADAIAISHLIERVATFKKGPRVVLFVDVGATSVKAYAIEFRLDTSNTPIGRRLSCAVDTNNGGTFLTGSLVGLLKQKLGVATTTDAEDC
jgi:hypothetical protein